LKLFIEIVGWIGAVEVIIAYALNSSGKMKSDSVMFQVLNLTGAIFLIANTWYNAAYPSVVINIIWTVIAIVALIRIKKKTI
jgi:energy-converting hydrogenase Eha subunit C